MNNGPWSLDIERLRSRNKAGFSTKNSRVRLLDLTKDEESCEIIVNSSPASLLVHGENMAEYGFETKKIFNELKVNQRTPLNDLRLKIMANIEKWITFTSDIQNRIKLTQ